MRCKITLVNIIILSCTGIIVGVLEEKPIPDHLLSCYRDHPTVLPQTMETLIEIIRKIEMAPNFNMDMKIFSNALLHRFRVDGIEKDPNVNQNMPGVLPYKTSGFQSYKQQILFQYLIPDNNVFFPLNILSEIEKCNLHWMLSSTVDIWERGDEIKSCPQSVQGFMSGPLQRFGAKMSSCPEEWGVVYQEHGTVSPGTVIAGIAAGLAPLAVQESLMLSFSEQIQPSRYPGWVIPGTSDNTVNNTYAATLSGDLAEVTQFQTYVNDVYFGPAGVWNDSYVPTASYFANLDNNRIEKKIWQITDAEILGGVDGLLLSNLVLSWMSKLKDLRLSQVLDMYYSDKGVLSDSNLRSCNREISIDAVINRENQSLVDQVQNFANVLATKVPSYSTDPKINIAARSLQVVNKFTPYLSNLMRKSKCLPRIPHSEKINLNVIIDQTWPSFTTLQLMMFLSRAIDVNYYGSSMTVINGQKEKKDSFIVNNSLNTTAIYLKWTSSVIEPYSLNFPESLLALKAKVEDSIELQKTLRRYHSYSHITLVIGYSSTITDADHDKAKTIVSAIKALNPDMKFVYVTSRTNSQRFVQLTGLPGSQNDKIVSIDSIGNIQSVITQLQDPLSLVPRSLIGPFCGQNNRGAPESEYEEYVTPGQPLRYRIHPDYLCGSSILQIKIINWDYGDIQVCMARDEVATGSALCKAIRTNEQYNFSISKPCIKPKKQIDQANSKQQWLETCKPVFLDVSSLKSLNKCSENECRYPDQVKFNIILQGLQCVEPYKTVCASASTFTSSIVTIISILLISAFNNFI